jgi:hypothetical protein
MIKGVEEVKVISRRWILGRTNNAVVFILRMDLEPEGLRAKGVWCFAKRLGLLPSVQCCLLCCWFFGLRTGCAAGLV